MTDEQWRKNNGIPESALELIMKTDEQWCQDNGVPETARYTDTYYLMNLIKIINGQLKKHNIKVKTKHRRGHGSGFYVWAEKND